MKAPVSIAAVMLFVVLAFIPLSDGDLVVKWEEGESQFTWVCGSPIGGMVGKNLSVPKSAEIYSASLNLRGDSFILDEGQEYQTLHYPTNVAMDFLNDGTPDWKFPGQMGHQTNFLNLNKTADDVELSWDAPGATRNLDIRLPKSNINSFSMIVNNTRLSKYSYSMSVGDQPVWNKESLSFSKLDTSFTKENINHVVVGDINGDLINDMVAAGANGKIYIARSSPLTGKFNNATMVDCYVEGNQRDMLQVALGNVDGNPGLDIVAACADGNFYYLVNQGGAGLFGGATRIETGAGGRMASVAVGDLNSDGFLDILGGALNGRFYVLFNDGQGAFDTSAGPGTPFYKIVLAGSGQMNDVDIADMDGDTFPDIVGANANKQFYIARNNGAATMFDSAYPVVTGAARDMNSVAAEDLDLDQDLDLIGASNDGKVYIALNLGYSQGLNAGEFDTAPGHVLKITCETGTNSLRTAVVKDMNSDGFLDILALGTSNQGQVYLQLNDGFGNYKEENLIRAYSAGQSAKSIASDLMDKDQDLDIVVANGLRMDVWSNNQGKFSETLGGSGFVSAIQNYLNTVNPEPDEWGNPMVSVRLQILNRYIGALRFTGLNINYTYTAKVDFTSKMSDFVNASSGPQNKEEKVHAGLSFSMESAGKLNISELGVEYEVGLVPIIDTPEDGKTYYRNQTIELSGRSNYDPEGSLFNYSWKDLTGGRLLGYGNKKAWTPVAQCYTLQLTVRDDIHGRESSMLVRFNTVPRPMPYLAISSCKPDNWYPQEGAMVMIKVAVRNTGKVNATQVGFQVFLDTEKSNPIGSGVVDRVDIGRTASTEIYWQAAGKPGDHRFIVKIVQAQQQFSTPPVAFKAVDPITLQEKLINKWLLPAAIGIIVLMSIVGAVGYIFKKRRDAADIRKEEEEKKAAEAKRIADEQAIYGLTSTYSPSVGTASPYSGPSSAAASTYGYDAYGAQNAATTPGADPYAPLSLGPSTGGPKNFACPKCGKPTEEKDLVCLECNATASIEDARKVIAEADEMALDTDEARELLKKAEAAFKEQLFADAVEAATDAEENARTNKERFEKAYNYSTGEEKAVDTTVVVKPRAPAVVVAPKPKPAVVPSDGKCRNCGKDLNARWKACPYCQTQV